MSLIHAFRYSAPSKMAADYTDAEKAQFKEEFGPTAKRYRLCSNLMVGALLVWGFLLVISATEVLPFSMDWLGGLFLFLWLAIIGSWLVFGQPVCPACGRGVDRALRTICPECGGRLVPGKIFRLPSCSSCAKSLGGGKSRHYTVRYCTHCGILLDERGI